MTKFTVGAQMYSVRTLLQTEEDMKAAFAQLKAMGYNEVQMSGYNFQIPPERIAALLEEAGFSVAEEHRAEGKGWVCLTARKEKQR